MKPFKGISLYLTRAFKYVEKINYMARFALHREAATDSAAILQIYSKNLITMLVFWAVFTYGLRVKISSGIDFFYYFAPAYLCWNLISDSVSSAYSFIKSNKYIVENSHTKIDSLLMANIYKNLIVHALLLVSILLPLEFLGISNVSVMKLAIGIVVAVLMSITFSFLVLIAAMKNEKFEFFLGNIVSILFWITPIVWSVEAIPEKYRYLTYLNPFTHVVDLYRNSLGVGFEVFSINVLAMLVITFALSATFAVFLARRNNHNLLDALK